MTIVRDEELLQYLEDELVTSRAKEIAEALEASAELREQLGEHEALIAMLAEPDPEFDGIDLVGGIRDRLAERPAPTSVVKRSWGMAFGIAAAAVILLAAVSTRLPKDLSGEFTAKSALPVNRHKWAGIKAYVAEPGGTTRPLASRLSSAESLVFTYSNLGDTPYSYLMIYGVDVAENVRWYYPAYTEAGTNPAAVPILSDSGSAPLPERIQHDLPSGRFVLHAVFMERRRTVEEVERMLADGVSWDAKSDVFVQRIEVEVP